VIAEDKKTSHRMLARGSGTFGNRVACISTISTPAVPVHGSGSVRAEALMRESANNHVDRDDTAALEATAAAMVSQRSHRDVLRAQLAPTEAS
jgi:hypothetical protein